MSSLTLLIFQGTADGLELMSQIASAGHEHQNDTWVKRQNCDNAQNVRPTFIEADTVKG